MAGLTSSLQVPEGAWDTHIHVTDPSKYPPSAATAYKVHVATLPEAMENAARLSLPNVCFVQTSTYGSDNRWIVDCLTTLNRRRNDSARAIIAVDLDDKKSTSEKALQVYHDAGVRGVRVNLVSVGSNVSGAELARLLKRQADLIRPLKSWSLQLHVNLDVVPSLLRLVDELGVKLCLDHMCYPPLGIHGERWGLEEWKCLLDLLESERAYIKLSAPYRFKKDGEATAVGRTGEDNGWMAAESAVKDLLKVRDGKAAVFASDWPHTRFEGLDSKLWVTNCLRWAKDVDGEEGMDRLFVENAKTLLDVR